MSDLKSSSTPLSTKIFVGGLSWDTTDVGFTSFFSRFGEIKDSVIMRDKSTGSSRGFGFVKFAEAPSVDKVLAQELELDGRKIDCKVAVPREAISDTTPSGQKTKKIFVGGLSIKTTQDEFKSHFSQFGTVVNAVIMMDSQSRRSRGFGFVTYESESTVDAVLNRTHVLNGKPVELKRAIPKEKIAPPASDGYGGGGGGGGGYDQRAYGAADYSYGGYGYPAYPSYPSYPGYEYPRPDAYREADYYGASRSGASAGRGYGYDTQSQAPATSWPGYEATPTAGYGGDYRYPAPPPRPAGRSTARAGAAAGGYGGYDQAGNGAYGYGASRTSKPDRNYHPYGR